MDRVSTASCCAPDAMFTLASKADVTFTSALPCAALAMVKEAVPLLDSITVFTGWFKPPIRKSPARCEFP